MILGENSKIEARKTNKSRQRKRNSRENFTKNMRFLARGEGAQQSSHQVETREIDLAVLLTAIGLLMYHERLILPARSIGSKIRAKIGEI